MCTHCADRVSNWEWSKNWNKQCACCLSPLYTVYCSYKQGTWLLTELFRTSTWTLLQSIFVLHVTFSCTVMPWSYMYAIYVRLWQFFIIFDRLKVFFSNFCSNVTKCNKCHIYKNHRRRLLIMFGLIWRYYGMGTVTRSNAGWVC